MNITTFRTLLYHYTERIVAVKDVLNALDNKIGDGDHGTNMARGFLAACRKLDLEPQVDLGKDCTTVAMTLLSSVGGASGPLYSTVFLKMGGDWKGRSEVHTTELVSGLTAALAGIQARGKAEPGDKTMVDVWHPTVRFITEKAAHLDGGDAASIAQHAALATAEMSAKRGRAAYLGPRSRGVCDPGSVSSAIWFEELFDITVGGVTRHSWETLVS